MEFSALLQIVGSEPIFETGLLLSGNVNPTDMRRQLSRWTAAGKLYQLRRGLYLLAPPYRRITPNPFLVANRLHRGSYVSLQSALAYYGMIPEGVPTTTSVTTGRPAIFDTLLGQFEFRHIQLNWFHSYRSLEVEQDQRAFIALPEKALLDLIYLQPKGDTEVYLRSLRLQAVEQIDLARLYALAAQSGKPKLLRSVEVIRQLVEEEALGYQAL